MVLYGIPEDLVITLRLDHREEYFSGGRIGLEGPQNGNYTSIQCLCRSANIDSTKFTGKTFIEMQKKLLQMICLSQEAN